MKSKKGFTLIELLAVIVILGILMLIAIPSVTKYISNAKKEAYVKTITALVNEVKTGLIIENNDVQASKAKIFYLTDIELEKGTTKTPYGNFIKEYSFVVAIQTDNNYTYQVQALDDSGHGIELINVENLTKENIDMLTQTELYKTDNIMNSSESILASNDTIKATPTLTAPSSNTTDASGLYMSNATKSGEPTYYFRGNVENNYVHFANQTWRIIRINEDKTIRMIMEDGINNNATYKYKIEYSNKSSYYELSDAKKELEKWYQTNLMQQDSKIALGEYCGELRASRTDYANYSPTFKCENELYNYKLKIGLLMYDEIIYAGGYYDRNNKKYYLYNANNQISTWSISPAVDGFRGEVWKLFSEGYPCPNLVDEPGVNTLRPVINLKADTIFIGKGTKSEPYNVY